MLQVPKARNEFDQSSKSDLRQKITSTVEIMAEKKLNISGFNSLDGPLPPSHMFSLHNAEVSSKLDKHGLNPHVKSRMAMMCAIGIVCGLVAWILKASIEVLTHYGEHRLQQYLDNKSLPAAWFFVMGWTIFFGLIASGLVVFFHPPAGGSGVPEVIGYLNGVDIKEIISVRTFFVKLISCISVNVSGLPVGAEGPIIHLGAIIGGGLSQGRSRSRQASCEAPCWHRFRLSDYRRDFTTAGVAGGVGAAFSAPLGGLLFSQEEVASYWNAELTVLIFACALFSTFTIQLLDSAAQGEFGDLHNGAFISIAQTGVAANLNVAIFPISIVIGLITGVFSAMWTWAHSRLFLVRDALLRPSKLRRMLDVVVLIIVWNSLCLAFMATTPCSQVMHA